MLLPCTAMSKETQARIYFLSDCHIRAACSSPEEQRKQRCLVSFLRSISGQAQFLYIVGDLFDFWFEYASVVPRAGAGVIFELYRLAQAGTRLRYIPGNHDAWIGSYLSHDLGLEIVTDPFEVVHQNRRIFVGHGDLIYSPGRYYRIIRSTLRNPLCVRLFGLIHPDMGARIARVVSGLSRNGSPCLSTQDLDRYVAAAEERFSAGCDLAIFGHVHLPAHRPLAGGDLIVLGDWERNRSYAVLEDGRISLCRWPE